MGKPEHRTGQQQIGKCNMYNAIVKEYYYIFIIFQYTSIVIHFEVFFLKIAGGQYRI